MPLQFHIDILLSKNIDKLLQQSPRLLFTALSHGHSQRPIFIAGKADESFRKLFQLCKAGGRRRVLAGAEFGSGNETAKILVSSLGGSQQWQVSNLQK